MLQAIPNHIYARNDKDTYRHFKFKDSAGTNGYIKFCFLRPIDSDLVEAILRSDPNAVREAIRLGANINAVETGVEWTLPLHWAAWQTNPVVIDILVEYGVNLHRFTEWASGRPESHPLFLSLNLNNTIIAKAMLKHMADLEEQPWYGKLPAHYRQRIGELRSEMRLVLEKGVDEVLARIYSARQSTEHLWPEEQKDPAIFEKDCIGLISSILYGEGGKRGDLQRMFYRLKTSLKSNLSLIVVGLLTPAVGSCLEYSVTRVLCTTIAAITGLSYYQSSNKSYSLNTGDISQGLRFYWENGVRKTLILMYNASRYERSYMYEDYSYRPVGRS